MRVEFPLILGAGYSCGDADITIQAIRNTITDAIYGGFKVKLHEDKGLVLGSYHNSSNFNKSIIEVRSDGGVNLYGLLEFVFKDMMLFAELKDNMLLNDFPKPFLTYVDFLRLFEIEDWVYENNFDINALRCNP